MTGPLVDDPALLERLALSDEEFLEHFLGLIANFPPREWTPELFERGLRYPWYRPQRSYVLRDGEVELIHDLEPGQREDVLARFAGRVPLLAFGSNVAPKNLTIKLAHHELPDDREVLVLAGELRDFDVVAAAAVAVYGAMPATLAVSPGTAVRAALLLVTGTQLTTLTWGEMPYRLGRLHGASFVVEDGLAGLELGEPLAFVSRWGGFAPDGDPVALAAVPATGRRLPAWTQRELLDRASALVLGPDGGGAEALTRAIFAGIGDVAPKILTALRPLSRRFEFSGWAPIAGPDPLS